MALKDWKKSEDNNLFTRWDNPSIRGSVFVSKTKSSPIVNKRRSKGFLVSTWIGGIGNEKRRSFSTKSMALKSARAYMRKY